MSGSKNKLRLYLFIFIAGYFLQANCLSTRNVRPLEKNQIKLGMDLGGPMIILNDAPFPVPFTAFTFSYGAATDITLSTGIFLTDALFGVIHIDGGTTIGLARPKGLIPGFSFTPALTFMIDVWEWNPTFYPSVDLNIYWNISPRNDIFYIGLNNWVEFETTRANGDNQPRNWIPSLNVGYTFVVNKWMLTIEAKYLGLNVSNQNIVVNYVSPGSNGAIGVVLSAARLF